MWKTLWTLGRTEEKTLVMKDSQLWIQCTNLLRSQVSEATWGTWFSGVAPVALEKDVLLLSVPSKLTRDRLESRFLPMLHEAASDCFGTAVKVELVVRPEEPRGAQEGPVNAAGDSALLLDLPPSSASSRALDSRYSFDTFVIGPSNRFAHAAALSVAEAPGRSYNPLIIYGETGLGKTHLLQAIGTYVRENFPTLRVFYASTEGLMNEFVDALRSNTTTAFRRRYRERDLLLIDDIQFMEGKETLQEELFHTFNSLYDSMKQVVMTCDRPPRDLATIEDRLRSRFMSGLTADVERPELETRLAILRSKADRAGMSVPDDVLLFIATHVKDNIRELEGALTRVSAFSRLNEQALNPQLAEIVLADIVSSAVTHQITAPGILQATVDAFGFSVEDLRSARRQRPLVTARQISMYAFRQLTDFSYPMIAREFGGRDHTTVIHAVEKIERLMSERPAIYKQVTDLISRVKNAVD